MNKITVLKKNLPEIIFATFCLRMLVTGASIGDAIALVSMVAIYGFSHYLTNKKIEQYTELKQDLSSAKDELRKEMEDLKNAITGLKLSQGIVTRKPNEAQAGPAKRYF